jgi:hypothetical protein
MEVTPNHTQTVAGWAAMNESGKLEPFIFKRRYGTNQRRRLSLSVESKQPVVLSAMVYQSNEY